MCKDLIFWGGTGQSIVLEEFLTETGYHVIAVFDKNLKIESPFTNVPIYHGDAGFDEFFYKYNGTVLYFAVAIAGQYGKDRLEVHKHLKSKGFIPVNAIHPKSVVASNVRIGEGCQILINSTVCAKVKMGDCVIINSSASVDHECVLGDGVHIGPGAKLAGLVKVGDYTFIGTNATILPRINIGQNVIVGAGSVVTKDVPDNTIVVGNPAKFFKSNK